MPEAKLSPALQTALEAIQAATRGMTNKQLSWHPEGKWSSAEILEHLSLAYARTVDRMKPVLQNDLPLVRNRSLKEWCGGLIVLRLGRIPPGRKAPEALSPRGIAPEQALAAARNNLAELDCIISQCQQRFGNRKNILLHPILGPLSTGEWRRFHLVHTVHHMRQIDSLRERMAASH